MLTEWNPLAWRFRRALLLNVLALIALGGAAFWAPSSFAACGATNRTWSGAGSTGWNATGNWSGANVPDTTTENAIFVAAARVPRFDFTTSLACVDLQSGSANAPSNLINLTVTGDYFKNPIAGSLNVTAARTFTLIMAGAAAQTLSNYDNLNYLTINNPTSVTLPYPFTVRNGFTISSAGTTVYVNANLTLDVGVALTIPATSTVEVASGAILSTLAGVTVNGTLKIKAGGQLKMGSATTLTVSAGGQLIFEGASGNIATMEGDGGATYTVNIAGSINANYFRVSHLVAAGLNITGTIQAMDNGEFHYLASAGYAVTLGAAAVVPTTLTSLGFYDSNTFGNVKNFNATAYNVSGFTVNNWSGVGGAANETDPNNRITWGTQAGIQLTLANNTAAGFPTSTIAVSTGPNLFATFAFALTNTSTATDITSVRFSAYSTATAGDISYIQVFKDVNANCAYNAGVDTQIGANLTMYGSPPTATVTIPAADVRTSGNTPGCLHVLLRTSATAQNANKIGIGILATSDVVNSQAYSFSTSSGPPSQAPLSVITGGGSFWDGSASTAWLTINNWRPNTVPTATIDCEIGSGLNVPLLGANQPCMNTILRTGGTTNFGGAFQLQSYGNLSVETGHTFQNSATGILVMQGASNQSLKIQTAFPGSLTIANTGAGTIGVDATSTVNGNLTVTTGTLRINDTYTLTVLGNVVVQTGATLQIDPGGTLQLGSGSTLTVNTGGTLTLVGSTTKTAKITTTSTANAFTATINGSISARYYTLERLGTNGLTISAGATINATNHLQDGTFTYPVNNSGTLLRLFQQIPTNTLNNMTFDPNGSGATGITNVYTDASVAAGTLTFSTYMGSWAGEAYDNDVSYVVTWSGALNTLDITQQATGPVSVNQGSTYTMGRFGFKQTQAGTYLDTNLMNLKLTLTGTGSAGDVSSISVYYDAACAGSGGTFITSGTLSGSPASVTFTGLSAPVEASATTPPLRCLYITYDIAAGATPGNTVGVKIDTSADTSNSQLYPASGSTTFPVTLGTASSVIGTTTTWTGGAATTAWCTAANWNSGIPTSALNCVIPSAPQNPVISGTCTGVTPVCKNVTISSGTLTLNAGQTLDVYGSFANTGTFSQGTAILRFRDDGISATNQTLSSSSAIGAVTFTKTAGSTGTVKWSGTTGTIGTLTIPTGSNFSWQVPASQTLTLTTGVTITGGVFEILTGGTVAIPNGQGVTLNGGTFKTTGTNDAYPSFTATNPKVTVSGAGSWGFTATSGTINLTGFIFDYINTSGLNVGGSTIISNLNGGRFTNLSTTYNSVRAIQINTTGSLPATASNIGWNWGPNNAPPTSANTYLLATSTGCANQTMAFDQWFGDFFVDLGNPIITTKYSNVNCNLSVAASASPVALIEFSARGYDAVTLVTWTTGSELDHAGFNVFRSLTGDGGFVQVNPTLIRNGTASLLRRGNYRYVDSDVINGIAYYYMLEDVATNGQKTLHGPVTALPLAGLGAVPPPSTGTNSGSNPGGITPAPDPDAVDLGNGVKILSRTRRSMRVEITPPAPVLTASAWNGTYSTVGAAGFSSTLNAGLPELVERTVLIEVDNEFSLVQVTSSAVAESVPISVRIAPAPSWTPDGGGQLVPTWNPDVTAYGQAGYLPSGYFQVTPTIESAAGRRFLKIRVTPYRYDALAELLKPAAKITLDLGLDGSAWASPATPVPTYAAPSAVENTLRIKYRRTGIYQVSHDDLVAAGVDGPFDAADTSQFRLYHLGVELPLEVLTSNGTFSSGDAVRFYAYHQENFEDADSEVVLSRSALLGSLTSPKRVAVINADPSGLPLATDWETTRIATAEQNLYPMFDLPLGADRDHFFWTRLNTEKLAGVGLGSTLNVPLATPLLNRSSGSPVRLTISVQGGQGYAVNPQHHLGIYVNNVPFMVADTVFNETVPTDLEVDIPAAFFVDGTNQVRVQVIGDLVADGDWDLVYIDRVRAKYPASFGAVAGIAEVANREAGSSLSVGGFTNAAAISVYDVTSIDDVKVYQNVGIASPDGGATFKASFGTPPGPDGLLGRNLFAFEAGAALIPTRLSVGIGANSYLKSALPAADLIVLGTPSLLRAASELITHRRAQGLRVVEATMTQVYAEFSHGRRSTQAVREFLAYARQYWTAPAPRYLLILGDATFDPIGYLGYPGVAGASPVAIKQGLYLDYGSDDALVSPNGLPDIAVGRIPTQNPVELKTYINKLLDYESGRTSPDGAAAKRLTFVSGADSLGEEFFKNNQALAATASPLFTTALIDRTQAGSDAATRTAINSAFDSGSLALTYLGHGAEDRWASASLFMNADASSLRNSKLPIVIGLNCLNAYFYDADPTKRSLAESFLFNPSGGAIAFWGSTTMTLPPAQIALARAFFDQLGQETRRTSANERLGDLIVRAKTAVGISAASADTLGSYTLLGDPSMSLPASAYQDAPAPLKNQDDGGGFLGCGTLKNRTGGPGGPGSSNGLYEFALLLAICAATWARARTRLNHAN